MLNTRTRAEQVLAKLQSDERISFPALARSMGIPYERLQSYLYGRAHFPAELLPDLFEGVAEVDPALALWAVSTIAGLAAIRHELRPMAAGTDRDPVVIDALQTAEALGRVQGGLASAGAEIDHGEAAVLLPDVRRARHELGQAEAKLEAVIASGPQRLLPVEVRP